jgi:hypothetical protein
MEELKLERMRILSGTGSSTKAFTVTTSPVTPPVHAERSGSIARDSSGLLWRSLDGGDWQQIGASISGTINARFEDLNDTFVGAFAALESTVDARFNNFTSSVTGTLNMSSGTLTRVTASFEGNVDFLVLTAATNPPAALTSNSASAQSRRGGGWLREGFDWVFAGQSLTLTTSGIGPSVRPAVAIDESIASSGATTSTTTKARLTTAASPSPGWGFQITIPANHLTRTLRVAVCHSDTVIAFSASLTDGSASPVSVNCSAVPTNNTLITTTFNSQRPCQLVFSATVVAQYNAGADMHFGWATLSGNLP